jgi:arginine deiminase
MEELFTEALASPEARAEALDLALREGSGPDPDVLRSLDAGSLAEALVAGVRRPGPPRVADLETQYGLAPVPNWLFQRDPHVVVGSGVAISAMGTTARRREPALSRIVFGHHPRFAEDTVFHDVARNGEGASLEGGDVLVISPDVVVVGVSERSNREGVLGFAEALAARADGPRSLVLVHLPARRAYMHLDTVFTQVDRDACLVFPPVILESGSEAATVEEIDLKKDPRTAHTRGPLLTTLAAHGIDLQPISCGGADPVSQQREQWTDGANALAVGPGVIFLYRRNSRTAAELARHDFRVIEAEAILLGREEVSLDDDERVAVLISCHEISRARGGPHCLTHPLIRDDA